MSDWELFGIPMDGHTPTHGSCQVSSCDIEWAIATSEGKFRHSSNPRTLCLCSGHNRLFSKLSEVGETTLRNYRSELQDE